MSEFYTGLANTANALLKDKGQAITVKREVETYDPVTAEAVVSSVSEQVLNGAVFSKSKAIYDNSLDEEKIIGNTKTVLLSTVGSTFEPEINDKVIYDNKEWLAFGVSKLSPAGTDVIFKLGIMFLGALEVLQDYYISPSGDKYSRPAGGYYLPPE